VSTRPLPTAVRAPASTSPTGAQKVAAFLGRASLSLWSGLWWSLASFCLIAPSIGGRRSTNSSGPFWPFATSSMIIAFGLGCVIRWRRDGRPRRQVLRADVIFSATYPVTIATAALLAGPTNGITGGRDRVVWIVCGCVVGGVALLCARHRDGAATAFCCFAAVSGTIAALTWWIFGLGLVFVPLAVSYAFAATGREGREP
jgi:hypothetical protein